jgi:hypothetical protein
MNSRSGEARQLVEEARSMIGCPFILHGRNPLTGLDCVGLVAACLTRIGREPLIPSGYRLRNSSLGKWLECAEGSGLGRVHGCRFPGDVILVSPAAGQHHLLIQECADRAIHAHAGLRKVVSQPIDDHLDIIMQWRLVPRKEA